MRPGERALPLGHWLLFWIHKNIFWGWLGKGEWKQDITLSKPSPAPSLISCWLRPWEQQQQLRWPGGKSVCLWAANSGLVLSQVEPITRKLVFTASCFTLSIKKALSRTSRQVFLLCRWEKLLVARFARLRIVDRWAATIVKRCRVA